MPVQIQPLIPLCAILTFLRGFALGEISSARQEGISQINISMAQKDKCCGNVLCSVLSRLQTVHLQTAYLWFLWEVMKWRSLCQTQHFWTRFSPQKWKKSSVLFIDPRLGRSFLYRLDLEISQDFCWGFASPSIYTNTPQGTAFYPCHANLDAKWLPTCCSPASPALRGTAPPWAPLWDQFGSQLCSLSAVMIGVNGISFTCGTGKCLLLLLLAMNFLCVSSLLGWFMAPIAITAGKGAAKWRKLEIKAEGSRWVKPL